MSGITCPGLAWEDSFVIRGVDWPLRGSRYVQVLKCVKLLSVLLVQSIVMFVFEIK